MSVPTFTKSGSKSTTSAKLDKSIFDSEVKSHALIKQAYVMYQANTRENLSKTLRRGEVRGGGKKPWKQKGTGRARFGSSRVPIWRGGGITFGPLGNQNYTKGMTKNAKQKAIRQALSVNKDNVIVIDAIEAKDGRTAEVDKLLKKISATGNILLVVNDKTEEIVRATNNISDVKVVQAMYMNVYDIMNANTIVIDKKSLEIVENWLGESVKNAKETK